MTVGITEHAPDVVEEQWATLAYQHGVRDSWTDLDCFATEDEANAHARDWAEGIGHDNSTEHEIAVLRVVRVFRGPRTWADL